MEVTKERLIELYKKGHTTIEDFEILATTSRNPIWSARQSDTTIRLLRNGRPIITFWISETEYADLIEHQKSSQDIFLELTKDL